MCGIIGYVGKNQAEPILIEGLKRLEYRGYDSAGLAVNSETGLNLVKSIGRITSLERKIQNKNLTGNLGIAHTRWATHGKPSEINAHPHLDCQKEIAVVHNGIIENYKSLKNKLKIERHQFVSETDTEVLAYLIEKYYQGNNLEKAVRLALNFISGTYGICVISKREPDKIVFARCGSPLLLGIGIDEYLIASDASAILRHTKRVVYLEDGEIGSVNRKNYSITDLKNKEIKKEETTLDWDIEAAEKEGFDHFMLKEIHEQPEAVLDSTRGRLDLEDGLAHLGGLDSVKEELRDIKRIIIVSCGTAFYAGCVGEYMFEEYAGIPTEIEYASEFRYKNPVIGKDTLVLAISQSGETADTLAAIREAKRKGVSTLGIVNVVGSTIARETDAGVYNHAGPEIGVASTKAFVSQLAVLALYTLFLGRQREMSTVMGQRIARAIKKIPDQIKEILKNENEIKKIAKKYAKNKDYLYLGRKYNFPIALEGALKIKEIAYVHAEGYASGEMKHGPIALIDKEFPSVFIVPEDSVYEKVISNMEEIKARGGKIIAVTTKGNKEVKKLADDVIFIPKTLEMLTPILSVVPLQLLAYWVARERDCEIDKPRNLAKSVTVE